MAVSGNCGQYLTISGYLWLSLVNWAYICQSLTISGSLWWSRAISGNIGQILDISGYLWLSQAISGYLGLSQAILGYLELSRTISDYPRLSWTISDYFDQGASSRVQVISIWKKRSHPHDLIDAVLVNRSGDKKHWNKNMNFLSLFPISYGSNQKKPYKILVIVRKGGGT